MGIRNKNGKLEYRFTLHGQKVQESTGLADTERNRKRAAELEASHRAAILEGRLGIRKLEPRYFSDAVTEWLAHERAMKRTESTVRRHETSMASLREFFEPTPKHHQMVGSITTGQVERYIAWRLNEHGVREVTVKHDVDALSVFFAYAIKNNYARENPTRDADKPSDRDARRMNILSPEQERAYFSRATGNLYDVGRLMILQGPRPDEVMSARKADVDLEAGTWRISKSKTDAGRGRVLKLTQESLAIIGARMGKPGPWLFPNDGDPQKHIVKLNGTHERVIEKIGFRFVLYDLRHTFATRLAAAGVGLETIKAILGHVDIRITQRYVHPTRDTQFKAMAVYEQSLQPIVKGAVQ